MIDIFTKNALVKPLKGKKAKTVLDGFVEAVKKSKRKPNKLCVDQGRECYYKHMQKWLDDNDVLLHSNYNERKKVVSERFIRALKDKIY